MNEEIILKEQGKIKRLTNKTFNFDKRLGEGFFAANYFLKTNKIVKENIPNQIVTMQFFQRQDDVMLCGIDEAIALVQEFATNPEELEILALNDGDIINANEPVLKITGKYENFGFLESMIDGILARRTSVSTNCYYVKKVLNGKNCFSMADRQDDYLTQIGDGYATYVAGIKAVSTDAQGYLWNGKGQGTMPHALIQLCKGDICLAADYYLKSYPNELITALVDYHNDVITDALKVARHLKHKLKAVRIDTSKSLIDHYFDDKDTSSFDPHGVCKELVFALREALDKEGFNYVKIVVSSSFDYHKIKDFEDHNTPVDTYGVGTSLCKVNVGFTGDLVKLNGEDQAKEGRRDIFSSRLEKVVLHAR